MTNLILDNLVNLYTHTLQVEKRIELLQRYGKKNSEQIEPESYRGQVMPHLSKTGID
jgi:hypothetical protein